MFTGNKEMQWSRWSDLPPELLSIIAERLERIEFLSFRSVCKAWNSACCTISAQIESTPNYEPWFLLYGDGEDCPLVIERGRKFTMRLPELVGTTCLASNQGWLLVSKQRGDKRRSSMFFFRPFSKTKIDLPDFPTKVLRDYVAAFSCPPTSQDCTVCVINQSRSMNLSCMYLPAEPRNGSTGRRGIP